jgi:SNF2 family DNA or RNA helicase
MRVTAKFISEIQAQVTWGNGSRDEWQDAKTVVKDTRGASFDPAKKVWNVHVDNLRALAQACERIDLEFGTSDRDWAWFREYERRQEQIAFLSQQLDVAQWVQPDHLLTEPRGYQKVAIDVLGLASGGVLLGDPVGSGKTIECIGDMLKNGHIDLVSARPNQVMFLVPATLKDNILKDFAKHTDLAEHITVVDGTRAKREKQWAEGTAIKVASYAGTLIYDRDILPENWNRVYADEFNAVKNYKAKTHQFLKELHVRDGLVGMTATPIELHLGELYGLYQILQPGMLGHWPQFARDHLVLDYFGSIQSSINLVQLSEKVAHHQIKRKKSFILPQLPPKVARTYKFELSAWERKEYKVMADDFLQWVRENAARKTANTLRKDQKGNYITAALRLRQFLDSPSLVDPAYPVENNKMQVLTDLIESIDGKIVVFSQWSSVIRMLNDLYVAKGYKTLWITGEDVPVPQRMPIVNQFNSAEDDTKILFTTDALARGYDLIGADTVIHFDSLWNPAKMIEQREGRLHRMNREGNSSVLAIRLVSADTIEEGVERALFDRADLADSVEGFNEDTLKRWGAKEWKRAIGGLDAD